MGPYSEAVRWVKSARPRRFDRWRFAERALGGSFVVALPLLAAIGLVAPDRFGSPGSNTLRIGWPRYVIVALVAIPLLMLASRWRQVRWFVARTRDPFIRPPHDDKRFEAAADALAASGRAAKLRFAAAWVWGPAGLGGLGVIAAFATAYFIVDAVLARFQVEWQHALFASAYLVVGMVLFALSAPRLATWRLATSVHRSVTQGY